MRQRRRTPAARAKRGRASPRDFAISLRKPRDQLLRVDGLDEVVVGADQETDDPVGSLAPLAADEHDRQLLAVSLPQLAADLVAGRSRKDHVEDDRSGRERRRDLDRVLTARDVVPTKPGAAQGTMTNSA